MVSKRDSIIDRVWRGTKQMAEDDKPLRARTSWLVDQLLLQSEHGSFPGQVHDKLDYVRVAAHVLRDGSDAEVAELAEVALEVAGAVVLDLYEDDE